MKVYTVHEVLESTKKKLAEITAERDALAAQVESCNDALKTLLKSLPWIGGSLQADGQFYYKVAESVFKKAESSLAKTPQQCLAEIRAQAIEGFCKSVDGLAMNQTPTDNDCSEDMVIGWKAGNVDCRMAGMKYAAKVRQGGE